VPKTPGAGGEGGSAADVRSLRRQRICLATIAAAVGGFALAAMRLTWRAHTASTG